MGGMSGNASRTSRPLFALTIARVSRPPSAPMPPAAAAACGLVSASLRAWIRLLIGSSPGNISTASGIAMINQRPKIASPSAQRSTEPAQRS